MPQLSSEDVIEPSFIDLVKRAYGIENLSAGRHILRDMRGWKLDEMDVQHLWIAEIKPAHLDSSCLMVLTTTQQRFAMFAVATHPWFAEYPPHIMPIVPPTIVAIGPVEIGVNWNDPISISLTPSLSLLLEEGETKPGIHLDGISYKLFLSARAAQVALQFSSPHASHLVMLEAALLEVANMLATKDDKETINQYIRDWTSRTPYQNRLPNK